MANFSEFVPRDIGNSNCDDKSHFGRPSSQFHYIMKSNTGDEDYPSEACEPWYHAAFQVDSIQLNTEITGNGDIDIQGAISAQATIQSATEVSAAGITLTSRKPFDIPHPVKKGYRLRHVCLEGPESGVYYRGRLKNSNVINLPEYWSGLVDPESITVTLTQIGSSQDLIVDKIEWGRKVLIKSGNASNIDCYFLIHGERKDGEKLIVEYEGESSDDYPGDNSIYSINK